MNRERLLAAGVSVAWVVTAAAQSPAEPRPSTATPQPESPAQVSSLQPEQIEGFESYAPAIQDILRKALQFTSQNLRYQFASSDPKAGGMDCSGTIYRLLMDAGFTDTPRQSDQMCRWVMLHSVLYRTEGAGQLSDAAFSALRPGDLLFWTGTYETGTPRDPPISHVMIYLGRRKPDGKPVIFGASEGRSYDGQRRNGVSVFDFAMPDPGEKSAFYGYGTIPGLGERD